MDKTDALKRLIASLWGGYSPTPLLPAPRLAADSNIAQLFLKCEDRRPLGNFKSLGGASAGLSALARAAQTTVDDLLSRKIADLPDLVCASDGNHGLAVATAARRAGVRATIFLPQHATGPRAQRIIDAGGSVVWVAGDYEDAVEMAAIAAARGDGLLISDTSEDVDDVTVREVMAGYGLIADELRQQCLSAPTHLFLQAGCGGFAAALTEGVKSIMSPPAQVVVVEPEGAACVAEALRTGVPTRIAGDLLTGAEMLACGQASAPALSILEQHQAKPLVLTEDDLAFGVKRLAETNGLRTTPSGGAGLAGFLRASKSKALRNEFGLNEASVVLCVITEGALDAQISQNASVATA